MLLVKKRPRLFYPLMIAQQGRCFWCGGEMRVTKTRDHSHDITWEHLVPRADFSGRNVHELDNLVLAHMNCNHKRDRTPLSDQQWQRALEIHSHARALAAQWRLPTFKHYLQQQVIDLLGYNARVEEFMSKGDRRRWRRGNQWVTGA